MRHLKHLLAITVAALVALVLAVPAYAASITITRDETYDPGSGGRTYTAYKVFDADYDELSGENTQDAKNPIVYTPSGAAVAYTMALDNPWVSVLWNTTTDQPTTGQTWFIVKLAADGSKYVVTPAKPLTDSDAPDIAAFLKEKRPSSATGTTIAPDGVAVEVDDGYYYIEASDGATNATLVTTDVTIVEKNTYIVTSKATDEKSYSIGETVSYTATVSVPADASLTDPIILHDEMDDVLAFKNDVTAKVDGAAFTGFTVKTTGLSDTCTFEISIPVTEALLGKTITFTYSAELTSAAVNPDTAFINKLYGEKNGYKTNPTEAKVWTFDFDFKKTFKDSTSTALKATFELRTDADDPNTAIKLIAGSGAGHYVVADAAHASSASAVIESANNAAINVQGLKAGTYYLVETSTSTGYNLLTAPAPVVITDTTNKTATPIAISHTATVDGKTSTEQAPAVIENNKGTILPSTGGMGTTILYVIGGLMIVGGCVALVTKKRMANLNK